MAINISNISNISSNDNSILFIFHSYIIRYNKITLISAFTKEIFKMAMNISNNYSEIGGLVFFLAHISDCLPYVILVSLGSVIGVIGSIYMNI